jgi:hypothetical protein
VNATTRHAAFFAIAGTACSACLAQTGTPDQLSPMSNANYNLSAATLTWQQQIRTGIDGQLEGITLTFTGNAGAQADLRIRLGAAWSLNSPVFSTTVVKSMNGLEVIFVDMTAANIILSIDEIFVLETQGDGSGLGLQGSYIAPPGTPEYLEPLWLNSSVFAEGWRHGFQTYMLPGGGVCYANCDGSTTAPILNVDDFTCFINEFAAAQTLPHEQQISSYANCDGSTIAPALNVDDFTCFINAFAQGCP